MPERTARLVFGRGPGERWTIRRSTTKDRVINYEIPDKSAALGTIVTAENAIAPLLDRTGIVKRGALYYIAG